MQRLFAKNFARQLFCLTIVNLVLGIPLQYYYLKLSNNVEYA